MEHLLVEVLNLEVTEGDRLLGDRRKHEVDLAALNRDLECKFLTHKLVSWHLYFYQELVVTDREGVRVRDLWLAGSTLPADVGSCAGYCLDAEHVRNENSLNITSTACRAVLNSNVKLGESRSEADGKLVQEGVNASCCFLPEQVRAHRFEGGKGILDQEGWLEEELELLQGGEEALTGSRLCLCSSSESANYSHLRFCPLKINFAQVIDMVVEESQAQHTHEHGLLHERRKLLALRDSSLSDKSDELTGFVFYNAKVTMELINMRSIFEPTLVSLNSRKNRLSVGTPYLFSEF